MKKINSALIASFIFFVIAFVSESTAQTLNVVVGNVVYQIPAAQANEMVYSNGSTLTILNKVFTLSDIDQMYVDDTEVTDNLVSVEYNSSTATVYVAGNVAQYVTPSVSGANVTIAQSNTDAVDGDEITYQLSGTSTDGSLTLSGSYKCTVSLAGVTLTSTNGAAINITNSKRIQLSAKKGTTNTLTDCSNGSQKACIYSKGQLQIQGNGTLNVIGNTKHGIKSASYISIKNLTLNITSAASDGINCEEYFLMKSGTVTISGVSGDGIQCDLGSTSSTGETTDHDDEDSGNIYIEGGTLNVTTTATATKCVKSEGDISVSGGTITLTAKGAVDTSDTSDLSYAAGFKADGDFSQSGGDITITVTGASGRGIGVNGTFTTTSSSTGTLTITNSGALTSSGSTYFATAKGIKAGVVAINGGTIKVTMSGQASKGIKSDESDGSGNMTITGGTITVTNSGAGGYDGTERDAKGAGCLKADKNMTISGGTLTLKATGTGGKGIKADGTLTISGGSVSSTTTGSQYKYSNSLTASPKGIKSTGAMTVSGGEIIASSSNHEGIETKSTLKITDGYIYAYGGDDAINSAGAMTISGGYIMANSSGNDGIDSNGNMTISGGTIVAVGASEPEVGIDVIENGTLTINGGNIIAIGGLENTNNVSGTAYQASSYTKGSWYGFYNASGTLITAFKVPSNSRMGTPMVAYTSTGTPSLKSGVTASGTSFWNGYGYTSCSGGSTVSLSTYTKSGMGGGGNDGPGGGGNPGPGGGGNPGGGGSRPGGH